MPITIDQYKQKVLDGFEFSQEQLEGAVRFINDLEVTTKRLRERGKTELADKLSAISAGIRVVITADVSGKDEPIGDMTRHDWEDAMASLDGLASIMTDSDIRSDIASATGAGDKELFGKEGEELFAGISLFSQVLEIPDVPEFDKHIYKSFKQDQNQRGNNFYDERPNERLSDEQVKQIVTELTEPVIENDNFDFNNINLDGFSDDLKAYTMGFMNDMNAQPENINELMIDVPKIEDLDLSKDIQGGNEQNNADNKQADDDEIIFDPNEFGKDKNINEIALDGDEIVADDIFDGDEKDKALDEFVNQPQGNNINNEVKQEAKNEGELENLEVIGDIFEPQNQTFDYNEEEEIKVNAGDDGAIDMLPDSPTSIANDRRFTSLDDWKTLKDDLLVFLPEGRFDTEITGANGLPMTSQEIQAEAEEQLRNQFRSAPDYTQTKERVRFLTQMQKTFERNNTPMIEEDANELAEKQQHLAELDAQIEQQIANAKEDALKAKDNFDPDRKAITGINKSDTVKDFVLTEEGASKLNRQSRYLNLAFKDIAEKQSDRTIRRAYSDLAYLTDPLQGSFSKARLSRPYLTSLSSLIKCGPNYVNDSINKQRETLGKDLSDAINDIKHYAVEEIKAENHLQRIKQDKERTPEEDKKYLERLYKTHSNLIKTYDKLTTYKNDPEGKIEAHFHGSIEDTLAAVSSSIGYIRGEKMAIENGWGAEDLAILGVVGAMDQSLRKLEREGTQEQKQGIEAFRDKFTALKAAAYGTYANTSKEKKQIAEQVKALLDDNDNSPAAQYCKKTAADSRQAFDNAFAVVNKQYERQRTNGVFDNQIDNETTQNVQYLKDLFFEARDTKDVKRFASEYVRIKTQRGNKKLADSEAFREFEDDLTGFVFRNGDYVSGIGMDMYSKIYSEICRVQANKCSLYGQMLENTAEQIREGRLPVDEKYADVKTDNKVSMALAADYIRKHDELKLSEQIKQAADIQKRFQQKSPYIEKLQKFSTQNLKSAIHNGMDAFTPQQRLGQLKEEINVNELSRFENEDRLYDSLNDSARAQNKYVSDVEKTKAEAQRFLNELTTLKNGKADNSLQFMRMYHALEDVVNLEKGCSPAEVSQRLKALNTTSNDYYDKIHSHTFAGISKNGSARYQKSFDIAKWTVRQENKLSEQVAGSISANRRMDKQIADTKTAKDNFLNKPIDLEDAKGKLEEELKSDNISNDEVLNVSAKLITINKFIEAKKANPELGDLTKGELISSQNEIIKSGELKQAYYMLDHDEFVSHVLDGKTIVNDMSNARKEMQNNQQIMQNANHVELNANKNIDPKVNHI